MLRSGCENEEAEAWKAGKSPHAGFGRRRPEKAKPWPRRAFRCRLRGGLAPGSDQCTNAALENDGSVQVCTILQCLSANSTARYKSAGGDGQRAFGEGRKDFASVGGERGLHEGDGLSVPYPHPARPFEARSPSGDIYASFCGPTDWYDELGGAKGDHKVAEAGGGCCSSKTTKPWPPMILGRLNNATT